MLGATGRERRFHFVRARLSLWPCALSLSVWTCALSLWTCALSLSPELVEGHGLRFDRLSAHNQSSTLSPSDHVVP